MKIDTENKDGLVIFTLTNPAGMSVRLMNLGATILGIHVPDRDGNTKNVVLAYDKNDDYKTDAFFMGGVIGRATNRIAGGQLLIDGDFWQLSLNDPPGNHLHGGNIGFNKKIWNVESYSSDTFSATVLLSLKSLDGEEGYPGHVTAWVRYSLTARNEWLADYQAISDKPTLVNMTNHSYFNLSGAGNILDHTLSVFSDRYSPADADHIATGDSLPVDNTPFDLRQDTCMSEVVLHIDTLNYCFSHHGILMPVARLVHPPSGRCLDLSSTSPGLQVYTGQNLSGSFAPHQGLCLEPQHYPYLPGKRLEPQMVLRPGQVYAESAVYRFSVKGD